MKKVYLKPFLKWAGSKRQLLQVIDRYIPQNYDKYFEPFLGGGSVFFHLMPEKAVINDINKELMNSYLMIRDQLDSLMKILDNHIYDEKYFYAVREVDRLDTYKKMTSVFKASRFIYLNRVCFNGLYRVNQKGQFNAPFGRYKNPTICNKILLTNINLFLNNVDNEIKILNCDFEEALKGAKKGDFIYFDPPYDTDGSNFTNYTKKGFNKDDQIRLKKIIDSLTNKGCKCLLSNSNTEFIQELYKNYLIKEVKANRLINSDSSGRGEVTELLIMNYNVSEEYPSNKLTG